MRFPEYRKFGQDRIEASDAMMALLIGSRLGSHTLTLAEGSPHLLGSLFPAVPEAGRLNRSVGDTRALILEAERHLAYMAIPYALSLYSGLLVDGIVLLRTAEVDPGTDEPRDIPLGAVHDRFLASASADRADLPGVDVELFEFIRWIRNRIVHRGAPAGSRLPNHHRQVLGQAAKDEWFRISRRAPDFGTGDDQMDLRSPELRVALAVTKHLAEAVNRVLQERVPRDVWARTVVADYSSVSGRRKPRVDALVGYARNFYGPLKLTEAELDAARG